MTHNSTYGSRSSTKMMLGKLPSHLPALEEWITTLPKANVGETRRLVSHALIEIQAMPLPAQQRFKALEPFRGVAKYLGESLKTQLAGVSFPLPSNLMQVAEALRDLHSQLAKGYMLITDELLVLDSLRQDFDLLTTSMQRALYYLGQGLLTGYQVYQPAASKQWHDIHRLYQAAERKGLQFSTVKDNEIHSGGITTVDTEYKRILLLALAEPNRLNQADMPILYGMLNHWAQKCRFVTDMPADKSRMLFAIDLGKDTAPTRLHHDLAAANMNVRLLDTTGLIISLRGLLPPEMPTDLKKYSTASWNQLVKQLAASWGMTARRRYSRYTAASPTTEIVFGLSACNQLLSSGDSAARENEYVRFGRSMPSLRNKPVARHGTAIINGVIAYTSDVVNEGAGGSYLKWMHPDPNKMRIGEIVALRNTRHDDHPWCVAIIRWIKTLHSRGMEYGVQLLGPDAFPVTVRSCEDDESGPDVSKCLFLPSIKSVGQPASLVVPTLLYRADDTVTVKWADREHQMKLGKVLDVTPIYSRFQCTALTLNTP